MRLKKKSSNLIIDWVWDWMDLFSIIHICNASIAKQAVFSKFRLRDASLDFSLGLGLVCV